MNATTPSTALSRSGIKLGIITAAILVSLWILYEAWSWTFCRFYVDIDQMAVITSKIGDPLPPGQILAEPGQQGVREQVLGEGRHFLNPLFYDWKIFPVVTIPNGRVGIVTAKVGTDLPSGEFIANRGQKGIWRQVLGPGKYRLNPYGYQIDTVDALSIPVGYVGVVTGLTGEQAPEGIFANPNQKGVRRDILQPGFYFINPKELQIDVLEIGLNQVSLLGKGGGEVITKTQIATQNAPMQELQHKVLEEQKEKRRDYLSQRAVPENQTAELAATGSRAEALGKSKPALSEDFKDKADRALKAGKPVSSVTPVDSAAVLTLHQLVEFPSRDGFEISLDMTVEFELLPEYIAWVFKNYGDLPAVVDKVIMPQILSVSRLKGSAYRAKDFIVGEGREKFQIDLTETLAKTLAERRVEIHNALIRHVNVPMQILDPIQQASIAVEENLTNKEKQNTARKQAELNTEQGLIAQRRDQVAQETLKLKAEIQADQEKRVAQIQAEATRQVAQIEQQTAEVRAVRARTLGKAGADAGLWVEGEKAAGLQLRVKAIGDPLAYSLLEFSQGLSDSLRVNILPTGPGTLWTDLDKAMLGALGGATQIRREGQGP
jgi:hypothetical protein